MTTVCRRRVAGGPGGVRFPLSLRLDWIGPHTWRLVEPFVFHSAGQGIVRVPPGFLTDLISLPAVGRLVFRPDGPELPAAIVHDFLYDAAASAGTWSRLTRSAADAVFLEAMRHLGVAGWRRWVMFAAVRLGGRRAWRRA